MSNHYDNEVSIENIFVTLVVSMVSRWINENHFHFSHYDLDRTNSCIDTHELRLINNQSQTGFGYKHRPGFSLFSFILNRKNKFFVLGHTCAGTTGYCDVFGKCRLVDAEGPLTRLKNVFLNEENIRTLNEIFRVKLKTNKTPSDENCFVFIDFRIIGGRCY